MAGGSAPPGGTVGSGAPPLAGIRVVELAHVMAGPACGLLLADQGADVIKVERLPGGDATRGFGPPSADGESAAFMMMNRGKRGVAVDLRDPRGRAMVRRLLHGADVVVENFRAGTMEGMGMGYDELAAANPRLVYCQITGFGRTGPMADEGGFDLIAQGYSGLMSITGEGPGRAPVKVGAPVTDITAGILAAFAVVTALFERERSGRGQRVDTSLLEAGITQTFWQSAIALASGVSPGPGGSAHPLTAPYQAFATSDGWVNVGASNEGTWSRLTGVLGVPGLRDDPRFSANQDRMSHLEDLVETLAPHFLGDSTDGWVARLTAAGVPAGPVATIGEMLEHPQTLAREMVTEVEHSRVGRLRTLGTPVKLERSDGARPPRRGAPLLGEHTREVLLGDGMAEAEVVELLEEGVLLQG
ncbi:MAG: CoA transferase [Gemmatimonadota bacterium]|nr:CoA transferase [Gemmatimonadota bacterium]MDH5758433.1 CoA transferase [Gemmatimonadota bacterium]